MKSTNSTPNALYNEQQKLSDYLGLIVAELKIQERRAKSFFRSPLGRIRAKKEVFRLKNEIEAKQKYLAEIADSIRAAG